MTSHYRTYTFLTSLLCLVSIGIFSACHSVDSLTEDERRSLAIDRWYEGHTQYEEKGDYVRAIEIYQDALSISPRQVILYQLGHCYMKTNDLDRAEEYLSRALEMQPDYYLARIDLQYVYELKQRINKESGNQVANNMRDLSWDYQPGLKIDRKPMYLEDDGTTELAHIVGADQPAVLPEHPSVTEELKKATLEHNIIPEAVMEKVLPDQQSAENIVVAQAPVKRPIIEIPSLPEKTSQPVPTSTPWPTKIPEPTPTKIPPTPTKVPPTATAVPIVEVLPTKQPEPTRAPSKPRMIPLIDTGTTPKPAPTATALPTRLPAVEKPTKTPQPVVSTDTKELPEIANGPVMYNSPAPSESPTPIPTIAPTAVPPTATPKPTAVPPTSTPKPTVVPPTSTPKPTAVPPTATPKPTAVPPTETPQPTATPKAVPTWKPSPVPTATAKPTRTPKPTAIPPSAEKVHNTLFPTGSSQTGLRTDANREQTSGTSLAEMSLNTFPYHFRQAKRFQEMTEYDRAIGEFEKALRIDPHSLDARLALGDCYRRKGNGYFGNAFEQYKKAKQQYPDEPRVYLKIGVLYMKSTQPGAKAEARKAFLQATKVDPLYKSAYNNLGILSMQDGDVQKAIDFFGDVLEIDPDYANAHLNLGILYQDYNRNENLAYYHYRRYLDLGGRRATEVRKWMQKLEGQ